MNLCVSFAARFVTLAVDTHFWKMTENKKLHTSYYSYFLIPFNNIRYLDKRTKKNKRRVPAR